MKQYISKEEFEVFRDWLVNVVGVQQSLRTNEYELIRWKHHLKGRPMPICFRRDVNDKVTLNGEASRYYNDFLRRTKC